VNILDLHSNIFLRLLSKYYHTVSHLYFNQIFGRILYNIKRKIGLIRTVTPQKEVSGFINPKIPFLLHDPSNNYRDIEKGIFRFLNVSMNLGKPINWNIKSASLLWEYNLHYFQYLSLLPSGLKNELCKQWIHNNKSIKEVGWNPYPLSLRIVNWIKAGIEQPDVIYNLYKQASYLHRSVEYFYSGNHLLENARALIFAGTFINRKHESLKWKETGLTILRSELHEQVLNDGGYYERSPMYHALMLELVLDIINILEQEHPDRPFLIKTAQRMSDYLISVTHPTGNIALLNDATEEIAPPTEQIMQYINRLTGYKPICKVAFPETGYFLFNKDPIYCVIDGAPVGPDHLLAHAHADIFSYELSFEKKKVIVDSGVYEYQKGAMRDYVRSTRAHNTVCIDGVDQVECWDRFRVARR
jgi:uncharacterized heparinase superfamily protein